MPKRVSGRQKSPEHPLPPDFAPNEATTAFAVEHGRAISPLVNELRVWSDLGNTSKDWQARLRQFVLNAEKRGEHPLNTVPATRPRFGQQSLVQSSGARPSKPLLEFGDKP